MKVTSGQRSPEYLCTTQCVGVHLVTPRGHWCALFNIFAGKLEHLLHILIGQKCSIFYILRKLLI